MGIVTGLLSGRLVQEHVLSWPDLTWSDMTAAIYPSFFSSSIQNRLRKTLVEL